MNPDTAIIIPVYNEEKVIEKTVRDVSKRFTRIICVNDGGKDHSSDNIRKTNALLVEHPINLGQGAALQTGIDFALQDPAIKYFITFDADGQHNVSDAEAMLKLLKKNDLDIVFGSRFLGKAVNISWQKQALLKLAVRVTNSLSDIKLTDTHNGLRVFNRRFAEKLNITMPGMAHASEIIDKVGSGKWHYQEAPVTINYSEYSKTKGQSSINSVNILFDMLLNKVKK